MTVAEGGGGGRRRGGRPRPARQARHVKPTLQLLSEAGGMKLHWDPRRDADGYMGTGYRGVHDDYWHTGYKKERPYVVVFEGVYQGRYATVEQADVCYARLEMWMPILPQQQPSTCSCTSGGSRKSDASPAASR